MLLILKILLILFLIFHIVQIIYFLYSLFDFQKHQTVDYFPFVSILKPVKGLDFELEQNFESFFHLDYQGGYEVIFALENKDDLAFPLVRKMQQKYPDKTKIVFSGEITDYRINGKVHNLIAANKEAAGEVLVVSDSDIRVFPSYLSFLVRPLVHNWCGAVTAVYKFTGKKSIGLFLHKLVCGGLFPETWLVSLFTKSLPLLGGSFSIRKKLLAELGGFEKHKYKIVEDYTMALLLQKKGYKVVYSSFPVLSFWGECNFSSWVTLMKRWMAPVKFHSLSKYLSLILFYFLKIVIFIALFLYPELILFYVVFYLIRIISAIEASLFMHDKSFFLLSFLSPLVDFLIFLLGVYFLFSNNKIRWRGREYEISSQGILI